MGILKRNLKARMVTYFLLLSVIVVIGLSTVAFFVAQNTLETRALESLAVTGNFKTEQLKMFVADQRDNLERISKIPVIRKAAIEVLAENPDVTDGSTPAYQNLAQQVDLVHATVPDLSEIFFLKATGGRIFFSTDNEYEGDYRVKDNYFTEGKKTVFVQNVYRSPVTQRPTMTVSAPLKSDSGEVIGVVAAHVKLDKLDTIVRDDTGLGKTGESYLINKNYVFLSAEGFGTEQYPRGVHSEGIDTALADKMTGTDIYPNYAGVTVIGSYRWIEDRQLALLTEIPKVEALAPARDLGLILIAIGLIAVGFLALGVYLIARQIARPIIAISDTVKKISDGDLNQQTPVLTQDETGMLAKNFNDMTSRLRDTLKDLGEEQQKSEALLLNVLPEPIAARLKRGEENIVDSFQAVTVAFADIVGFTNFASSVSPSELIVMLNQVFSAFDEMSERYDLEKIKTIGDAYMVVGGLPTPRDDHAEAIADISLDMQKFVHTVNSQYGGNLAIRIGINSGPVVAGVVGTKKFLYDIWGDAVNTAARMESHGVEGGIQVTEDTYMLLREKYNFQDRGIVDVKGKGDMHVYILQSKKNPTEEYANFKE